MRRSILAAAAIAASVAAAAFAAFSIDDGATGVPPPTEPATIDAPDAEVPDTAVPDAESPDAEVPDTAVPDAESPDAEVPDAEVLDTAVPDTDAHDVGEVPDAEVPDAGVPDAEEEPVPDAAIPEGIAAANNAFAADFYGQVSREPGNAFFSPAGIYAAFSLLYEGAGSDTAAQMQDAFGFEPDQTARHGATASMLASINRDDPYAALDMANALWLADWFVPRDSYLDTARAVYAASVETLDFTAVGDGGEKTSVKRMNEWASENTRGKIDRVVADDAVDGRTAMVINNAMYFNGTWAAQFPVENTAESDFYKNGAESVRVEFMNAEAEFGYAGLDGAQILGMPYEGDRLSMLVALPHDVDGIGRLEESLSAERMERWTASLERQEVAVSIPKFEFRTKYDLKEPLANMGVADVFAQDSSDLGGIADLTGIDGNLYVSEATQDAYVNVNEEGTEAAAVTTVMVGATSFQPPPRFTADHPFIFAIYDEESSMILFMGRVSDPG